MNEVKRELVHELMASRYEAPNRTEERLIAELTADQLLRRFGAMITTENAAEFAALAV